MFQKIKLEVGDISVPIGGRGDPPQIYYLNYYSARGMLISGV